METQSTAAATEPTELKGNALFPAELRTRDHLRSRLSEVSGHAKRTAVLVLHGIGSQKPYETLDQFTRGLLGFFRDAVPGQKPLTQQQKISLAPTQEILLRQHKANPNTNEKDWTQAFVRVCPHRNSKDVIDIYEYYWAPVITDRVSALQSLNFLISAGLSPFQYLRDNLTVINRAHSPSRTEKFLWLIYAFVREIYRLLFIFIPLLFLLLGVYWLLTNAAAGLFHNTAGILGDLLEHPPLTISQAAHLALAAVRFLLLGMCAIFLFQEFFSGAQGNPPEKSPRIYTAFIIALFVALFVIRLDVVQFVKDHILVHPVRSLAVCLAVFVVVSLCSKILRSAWQRAGAALIRHAVLTVAILTGAALLALVMLKLKPSSAKLIEVLALPTFLNWQHVIIYAFVALFIYISRKVLTSAIGCLAVYLGSDDLSKNYAARSQILHECTTLLIELLAGKDEKGDLNEQWNYDQVLVAAHSLGSVIAYDSLSQLIVRDFAKDPSIHGLALSKVKGLLTFGCPLNKVFYFFRSRTNLRTNVLSQILYALHPFRLKVPLPPQANPEISLPHPFPEKLPFSPDFRWYNAYSPFDIISGRMQFYEADLDVPVERGVTPWTAHLSYWENDDLYSLFSHLIYPRP